MRVARWWLVLALVGVGVGVGVAWQARPEPSPLRYTEDALDVLEAQGYYVDPATWPQTRERKCGSNR